MFSMHRSLHIVAALIALLMSVSVAAQEIIVEVNGDNPAAGSFRVLTGDWDPSTGKSAAPGATPGLGTLYVDGGEAASGVFSFNIPSNGIYEVSVCWSTSGNAEGVKYTINGATGVQEVVLDQNGLGSTTRQPNGNAWISLGNHALTAGPNNVLTVEAVPGTSPVRQDMLHRIYADAAKITRIADLPTDIAVTAPTPTPTVTQFPPAPSQPAPTQVLPDPTPRPPAPTPTPTQSGIQWQQTLEQARNEALSRNRPLAVYCFNHRSRLSREVTEAVLQDPSVIAALNGTIPVRLDLQTLPAMGRELGVYRVPTLILYASRGQEIDRVVGDFGPADVTELLARGH